LTLLYDYDSIDFRVNQVEKGENSMDRYIAWRITAESLGIEKEIFGQPANNTFLDKLANNKFIKWLCGEAM
jgi:hypothetical protein